MKKIIALALCLCMVLGLFGCAGSSSDAYVPTGDALEAEGADLASKQTEPETEQELTLVYYPESSLHPYECSDYTNRTVISLMYQSLFVVDNDYEVKPLLCKNYSVSDDMTVYTIYLHDATFSDGTPLTAEDVERSLWAAYESDIYRGRFHNVWDFEANEDGSLTILLSTPYENFPILLDVPIIKIEPEPEVVETQPAEGETLPGETQPAETLPSETQPPTEPKDENALPLGTGPYVFDTSLSGARLRRVKNWWCEGMANLPVTASSIKLKVAESPAQIRDSFEFEDVGVVCANPGSDSFADFRCDYELCEIESGLFLYIGFNMDAEGESLFKNQSLRQAFTHAIDRQGIADYYYRGYGLPASLPASPDSPYYDEALAAQYAYDAEAFKQAVINAGAVGQEITMLVNAGDSLRMRVAKDIEEMLEDAGLTVKLLEYEGDYYYAAISNRDSYDLYLAQTKLSSNMDLTPFFYVYGSLSYGALDNEAVYAMCKEALQSETNYYSLHKLVMDQGLLCPILFQKYAVYVTRGLVTGLDPARDNVFYYDFGVDMRDAQVSVDDEVE